MRHNLYAELAPLPAGFDLDTACMAVQHQLVQELGGELLDVEVSVDCSSRTVMINAVGDLALSARQLDAMINEQSFDIEDDFSRVVLDVVTVEVD